MYVACATGSLQIVLPSDQRPCDNGLPIGRRAGLPGSHYNARARACIPGQTAGGSRASVPSRMASSAPNPSLQRDERKGGGEEEGRGKEEKEREEGGGGGGGGGGGKSSRGGGGGGGGGGRGWGGLGSWFVCPALLALPLCHFAQVPLLDELTGIHDGMCGDWQSRTTSSWTTAKRRLSRSSWTPHRRGTATTQVQFLPRQF